MTNHLEHLSLKNCPCGRVCLATPLTCCWDQLFVYYQQSNPCHVVLSDKGLLCSEPVANRVLQILLRCNILVWIRCCVFTEGKANPCGVTCRRCTLWFGDLNYFKGVSFLNCHPNATFGLGVQHGSCWSQQHRLNIRSVMCNLQKIKLSDSQWDSSFLFIPWPNTVLSFGLNSTNDASISSAGLAMSMNRDL